MPTVIHNNTTTTTSTPKMIPAMFMSSRKECDIMRSKSSRGVLKCGKQSKILTNFHHLWCAFWESGFILGSAIILPGVLLSNDTEFLRAINYNDLSRWIFVQWSKCVPMRPYETFVIHVYYQRSQAKWTSLWKTLTAVWGHTVNQQTFQTLSP